MQSQSGDALCTVITPRSLQWSSVRPVLVVGPVVDVGTRTGCRWGMVLLERRLESRPNECPLDESVGQYLEMGGQCARRARRRRRWRAPEAMFGHLCACYSTNRPATAVPNRVSLLAQLGALPVVSRLRFHSLEAISVDFRRTAYKKQRTGPNLCTSHDFT